MKKITAIILALILVLSFAGCSKSIKNDGKEKTSDANAAFTDAVLVNTEDETNTYKLNADGTYMEMYKGNQLSGTWSFDAATNTLSLKFSESVIYNFNVDRDEDGNVTGISQYEGRSFTFGQ